MRSHLYADNSVPSTAEMLPLSQQQRFAPLQQLLKSKPIESAVYLYAIFAFATCTSAFYLFGIATPALGLTYASGAVLILMCAKRILAQPKMLIVALSFPAIAVCSSMWSIDPAVTLRHSIQFIFTAMIGVCIGSTLHPRALFSVMTIAFVTLIVMSVANLWLNVVPAFQQKDYLHSAEYFTGIFTHKNTLGLVLTLGSVCLVYHCLSHKRFWLLFTSTLCVLLTAVFAFEILQFRLVDFVLDLAGKGRDLSGRTFLWGIATQQIADSPWLGVGYQSYWSSPRYVGEVSLIRGVMESSINSFHNVWLETLVGTGIVGFIAMAAPPVVIVCRFLKHLLTDSITAIDIAGLYLIMVVIVNFRKEKRP